MILKMINLQELVDMDNHFPWIWSQEAVLTLSDNLTSIKGTIIFDNISHKYNEIITSGDVVIRTTQQVKRVPHGKLIA